MARFTNGRLRYFAEPTARQMPTAKPKSTTNTAVGTGSAAARGAARRETLLDAAIRLFSKRGFRATGIVALAQEVGLTHVGLLHHFGTKQDLLHALVARREAEEAAQVRASPPLLGIAGLRALAKSGQQLLTQPLLPRLYTVLIAENLDPDDPLHGYFVDRYKRVRMALAHVVRAGQVSGEIRPDVDADRIAAELLSFIVGTQTQWLLDADGIDVNGAYERYLNRLIADIQQKPP